MYTYTHSHIHIKATKHAMNHPQTQEEVKIVQSPIIAVQAATSNEATPTTAQTTPTSGEAATDEVLRVQPEREQNAKRVKLKKKGCKCSIQ